jgi:CheY-like chemotaxis protein
MMTDLFRPVLRGVRVLLVDDHEDSSDQFDEVLRGAGALVTTVGTAREALQSLGAVDIVVTNLALPDHNGPGDLRELAAPGFTGVLRKPVDPWRLITEIRLALDR